MSEAPERIWMDPDIKFPECEKQYGCDVEYVRADHVKELEAKLAKAMEIIQAYGEDEGYVPRRVADIYDELKGEQP